MKNCPHCNIEHEGGRSFGAHLTNCKMNPKYNEIRNKISSNKTLERKIYKLNCKKCNEEYEIEMIENNFNKGKYKKYCSRKCANSHIRTEESKIEISNIIINKIRNGEILGLNIREKRFCKNCNKKIKYENISGLCMQCVHKSEKYKEMMSNSNKGNTGGYREKGGRGKQGWYKGFFCNSSWELAYVIYCIDNNIIIKRNTKGFEYIFENEKFKYYPDFIKEDDSYVEIKGYLDNKNKEKIKQFKFNIELIDKNKIYFYINYVIEKYGKDYIKLYE